jgi:hypothetical protein
MSEHPIAYSRLLRSVNRRWTTLSVACLGLLFCSSYALADFVGFPGAEYDSGSITVLGDTTQNFDNGPTDGPYQSLTVSGQGGYGFLSGFLLPNPAVEATATDTTAPQTNDNLILTFHAEIFGPPGPVNLIIKAPGTSVTTNGQGSSASAALYVSGIPNINGVSENYTYEDNSLNGAPWYPNSYPAIADETVIPTIPGWIFAVGMQVSVGVRTFSSGAASIDPVFILPAGYTIELSNGVGNKLAAPEPSTWAMMLLGFASLGFIGWRGSRKIAAHAA